MKRSSMAAITVMTGRLLYGVEIEYNKYKDYDTDLAAIRASGFSLIRIVIYSYIEHAVQHEYSNEPAAVQHEYKRVYCNIARTIADLLSQCDEESRGVPTPD